MNTVQIGDLGESYAIMKFTQSLCAVSKPLTDNVRYDLIVDVKGKLYRVQVKTVSAVKDGKMEFAIKTTNYTKGSWCSKGYTTNEVNLFFLYCVENDWCGLYIPEQEEIQKNLTIRLVPPKNNQKIGIRLAKDYEFSTQLTLL